MKISEAFRFFDAENNLTVNKREFKDGLERLKLTIPTSKLKKNSSIPVKKSKNPFDIDFNSVFDQLDTNKIGYLTYQDF